LPFANPEYVAVHPGDVDGSRTDLTYVSRCRDVSVNVSARHLAKKNLYDYSKIDRDLQSP